MRMSFAVNKTFELWRSFMLRQNEVQNRLNTDMISMQVYDPSCNFREFELHAEFEKWAAVEVTGFELVPEGMEPFTIPAGLYAVFLHKGAASEGERTFRYIFGTWLPASDYELDNRPHFERLGAKYKNNDPESEEEIWIPVKLKGFN